MATFTSIPKSETLTGTDQDDTYIFPAGSGNDIISDTAGQESLFFKDASGLEDFDFVRASNGDLVITIGGNSVTISVDSYGDARYSLFYGEDDDYLGEIYAATTRGGTIRASEDDTALMFGGDGNDKLYGSDDDDVIYGEAGKDRLYGGEYDDTLYGGDNKDKLYGGEDEDTLYGGAGDDDLVGGEGDDVLFGGADDDDLEGGEDDDSYVFFAGDGDDTIEDDDGDEELYFKDASGLADFSFEYERDDLKISIGEDSVTIEDFDAERFTIFYGQDDDELVGVILGTSGDDVLESSSDDDVLYGGDGDDVYQFRGNDGDDRIIDSDGQETLQFKDANGHGDFAFARASDGDLVISVAGDSVTIAADSYEAGRFVLVHGVSDSELGRLTLGSDNAETLGGSAQADWIIAAAGNDVLNGEAGDDRLDGGVGNDVLNGEAGDDDLDGGVGNDRLVGGDGNDSYIFRAGDNGVGNDERDLIDDDGGVVVFEQGASGADYAGATFTWSNTYDGGEARTLTIEKDGNRLNVIEFANGISGYTFATRVGTTDTTLDSSTFVTATAATPDPTTPDPTTPDPTTPDPTTPDPAPAVLGSEANPFLATSEADSFTGSPGADWVSYHGANGTGPYDGYGVRVYLDDNSRNGYPLRRGR